MTPHITYILLHIVWSIVILDIFYLNYEVYDDQFCGLEVTSIDPVTFKLYVYN